MTSSTRLFLQADPEVKAVYPEQPSAAAPILAKATPVGVSPVSQKKGFNSLGIPYPIWAIVHEFLAEYQPWKSSFTYVVDSQPRRFRDEFEEHAGLLIHKKAVEWSNTEYYSYDRCFYGDDVGTYKMTFFIGFFVVRAPAYVFGAMIDAIRYPIYHNSDRQYLLSLFGYSPSDMPELFDVEKSAFINKYKLSFPLKMFHKKTTPASVSVVESGPSDKKNVSLTN